MQSRLELFKLVAIIIGEKVSFASLEEDNSFLRNCNTLIETTRRAVLRAAHWPCATEYKRLTIVNKSDGEAWDVSKPAPGWSFVYNRPPDMLAPRHLQSFQRFEYRKNLIHTNDPNPLLCYTQDIVDETEWDPQLYYAMQYVLAARLSLARNGKINLAADFFQLAKEAIAEQAADIAEGSDDGTYTQALPSFIAARGYRGPEFGASTRYIYPVNTLNVSSFNA